MSLFRPRSIRLAAAALALSLLLPACGFHLRNALTLPPDLGPVDIVSSDPYSRLARSVERALADALRGEGRSAHVIGGADVAAELDAKRAIDQGSRLAAAL